LHFQSKRMSSRGARIELALHRMTERALSVAVKDADFAPRALRGPDGIGSGATQPADRQAAKEKNGARC
jgi:hypothetical protein